MQGLSEQGLFTEMDCAQNRAYILNQQQSFSLTGYRVLQSNEKNCFVKCARLMYNGKIKIVYFTAPYETLEETAGRLTPDHFMTVAANLLGAVLEVMNNGFLSCTDIDIAPDRIYIEPQTLTVRIICLPLNSMSIQQRPAEFLSGLRSMLFQFIQSCPQLAGSPQVSEWAGALLNGTVTLQELCGRLSGRGNTAQPAEPGSAPAQPPLHLVGTGFQISFRITQPVFRLGRKDNNDGIVNCSKAVSREHCKIIFRGGSYLIMDLNSKYGTFVRQTEADSYGDRLAAFEEVALQNGSYIKLADVEFRAEF